MFYNKQTTASNVTQMQDTGSDVRKLVQQEALKNYRSGSPIVPRHTHDGNDNIKISKDNLNPGSSWVGFIEGTAGSAGENTLTLKGIANPSTVYFYGIAYNLPNYRAVINGIAKFGKVSSLNAKSTGTTTVTQIPNIIQTNTCTFFDSSGASVAPHVNVDAFNLGSIYNSAGDLIGHLQVIKYGSTFVTLQAPLDTGWTLQGSVMIT